MTIFDRLPRLSYAVTVDFSWRWFAPTAYLAALVAIAALVPLNRTSPAKTNCSQNNFSPISFFPVALTGYETISVTLTDFNAVPHHWFNRFKSAPLPGSLCEPHIFSVGDSLLTNYSIFPWTVQAIGAPDTNTFTSSLAYRGMSLENCDVTQMALTADEHDDGTITVQVACLSPFLTLTTSTSLGSYASGSQVVADFSEWVGAPIAGLSETVSEL